MMESPAAACPVCSQKLREHSGWMVRHSGRWLRFRTGQCVDAFERDPEAYALVDRGERRPDDSPSSEWACY